MIVTLHFDRELSAETDSIHIFDATILRVTINERGDSVSFDKDKAMVSYAKNLHVKPLQITYDMLPATSAAVESRGKEMALSFLTGKAASDYAILYKALTIAEQAGFLSIGEL